MTEWLRESQEATKELLKLKDHLIEVERNVSDLSLSGSISVYSKFNSLILSFADKLITVFSASSLLQNATLQAERQATQAQLKQLQSHSESQQAQMLALQRQAVSLQENNTTLQTHNANLQVQPLHTLRLRRFTSASPCMPD